MAILLPKSQLIIVELYKPTGTIKSLKHKHVFSSFPILISPKKEQFLTSSGLKASDTKIWFQLSLVFLLRTKISISKAVKLL